MGIVNREQPFDDSYSKEIVQRIREISADLDEYLVTQKYLIETPEENLSPVWIRNRLITGLIDQLSDIGIQLELDPSKVYDEVILIDAVITLFAKFGEDRFNKFLKDHGGLADDISQLIDDNCIEDIVRCISQAIPVDEGWESLVKLLDTRPNIISSDDTFNALISSALEDADKLGDPELVEKDDMDKLLEYTKFLLARKAKITDIACTIYAVDDTGYQNKDKRAIVAEIMKNFEKELSRPSAIRKYIDGEVAPKQFVEQYRLPFLGRWKHCLEFWVAIADHQAIPSDIEMAILVATLYVDAPDPQHARVHVVSVFENLIDVLGDRYNTFREIIDKALGNLVVVERGE